MTGPRLFLCSDLDRTLLPNGPQRESPQARALIARLVSRPEVTLGYVTGRHRRQVEQAIENYDLPQPDFAITDVGTRIHARTTDAWELLPDWEQEVGTDWAGHDHGFIVDLLRDLRPLRLQEPARQNTYKISYYLPIQADRSILQDRMQQRLQEQGIRASLIWTLDEPAGVGLLDVLPERATKLHAIDFIRKRINFNMAETLFAGNSSNDLDVMAGEVPSVLVANAVNYVREAAIQKARAAGNENALYCARGGYLGMNGNYGAGILEGLAHFMPELAACIE